MWRNLARMTVIVFVSSVLTGCYFFFPANPSVTVDQVRSIVAKDGYQLVNIGLTLDRPVDTKTFYGICKDANGHEYAYWIVRFRPNTCNECSILQAIHRSHDMLL